MYAKCTPYDIGKRYAGQGKLKARSAPIFLLSKVNILELNPTNELKFCNEGIGE